MWTVAVVLLAAFGVVFSLGALWACCAVASRADDQMSEAWRLRHPGEPQKAA